MQKSVETQVNCYREMCLSVPLQMVQPSHSTVTLDSLFTAAPHLSVCQESGIPDLRMYCVFQNMTILHQHQVREGHVYTCLFLHFSFALFLYNVTYFSTISLQWMDTYICRCVYIVSVKTAHSLNECHWILH